MTLLKTPVCDFGKKAESFELKSINNELISLNDVKGEKATLIMFVSNHCPYVKHVNPTMVRRPSTVYGNIRDMDLEHFSRVVSAKFPPPLSPADEMTLAPRSSHIISRGGGISEAVPMLIAD